MATTKAGLLSILVDSEQLALLKKLDFPCSQPILNSARETDEGIKLFGTWNDFESLVRWVAFEANQVRKEGKRKQTRLLDDVADQLEAVLAAHRPG